MIKKVSAVAGDHIGSVTNIDLVHKIREIGVVIIEGTVEHKLNEMVLESDRSDFIVRFIGQYQAKFCKHDNIQELLSPYATIHQEFYADPCLSSND